MRHRRYTGTHIRTPGAQVKCKERGGRWRLHFSDDGGRIAGMCEISLVARANAHGGRTAVIATEGTFTYEELLRSSAKVASGLLGDRDDLREE